MNGIDPEVLDAGMQEFCNCLKNNSMYYKATEMSLEVFFKIICYNSSAREWAQNNLDSWSWMVQWS